MPLTPAALRPEHSTQRTDAQGRRCGQGYIAAGKQCRQKGAFPTRTAIAVGLGAAGLTAGALALRNRRNRIIPVKVSVSGASPSSSSAPRLSPGYVHALSGRPSPKQPRLPGDRTTRRITGTTPYGLLPPSPPRQSKTARMRANTGAAIRNAESAITQTGREEVRRIAQIGNTMAITGEATGMATKTTLRELRLRAEAARRRFEPGYRRGRQTPARPQAQLPEGGTGAFQPPLGTPRQQPPASIPIDPRTGQPRRRRSRGFGRTDSLTPGKSLAR